MACLTKTQGKKKTKQNPKKQSWAWWHMQASLQYAARHCLKTKNKNGVGAGKRLILKVLHGFVPYMLIQAVVDLT
jgi:hypothetical protein